jgi:hypothetical protein
MSEWFTYSIPWWIWSAPLVGGAAVIVFTVIRFAGFRNGLIAAAGLGAVLLTSLSYWRGRQHGWRERGEKGVRDAKEFRSKADVARDRVRDIPVDRLRDDDGFRRKP